jgi:hypothetical protein
MDIANGKTEGDGRTRTESMKVRAMVSMEGMQVEGMRMRAMASTERMEVKGMVGAEGMVGVEGMAAVGVEVEGMAGEDRI